jgi:hypothetical protein
MHTIQVAELSQINLLYRFLINQKEVKSSYKSYI